MFAVSINSPSSYQRKQYNFSQCLIISLLKTLIEIGFFIKFVVSGRSNMKGPIKMGIYAGADRTTNTDIKINLLLVTCCLQNYHIIGYNLLGRCTDSNIFLTTPISA
jgi:hypothetical protein